MNIIKHIIAGLALAGGLAAQVVNINDTLTNTPGNDAYTGTITVKLNAPAQAYYGTTSLSGWQYVLCVGGNWGSCSAVTAAGVITIPLYATTTMVPSGMSYYATYSPRKGSRPGEIWQVEPSDTKLYQIIASTVPSVTTTFQPSQIAPGTNGQVLTTTAGSTAWGTASAAWGAITGTLSAQTDLQSALDGKQATDSDLTALAALSTTGLVARTGSATYTPRTITGTANQVTVTNGDGVAGAPTLSLPATINGLTSVTSTGFTGALTGNASTATALASTVASGRVWYGNGTGAPGSASTFVYDAANGRLGVGVASPAVTVDVGGSIAASGTYFVGSGASYAGRLGVDSGSFISMDTFNGTNFGGRDLYLRGNSVSLWTGSSPIQRATVTSTGNLLIGGTSDGNYKLDVQTKGSTGAFRVWDQTATTGSTLAVIQAGQGQSGNLMEWRNYAGTALTYLGSDGGVRANGSFFAVLSSAGTEIRSVLGASIQLGSPRGVQWSSVADATGALDLGINRNAAGVLEINNGTAGTWRDLKLRSLQWTTNTEATCNSTVRGTVTMVQGGAGVADTLRVCRKDAADAYAWTALY